VVGREARGDPSGDLMRTVRLQNVDMVDSKEDLTWIKPDVIQTQSLLGDQDGTAQW
jgi:hypothetical protein